jgi:quinol monooxygenase YgiN
MVTVGLFVRLRAKPGREAEVERLLANGLRMVEEEPETTFWSALKFDYSTFGIFDAFSNDTGRSAHLAGRLASALMAKAKDLLAEPPSIERVDVLAAKLPT